MAENFSHMWWAHDVRYDEARARGSNSRWVVVTLAYEIIIWGERARVVCVRALIMRIKTNYRSPRLSDWWKISPPTLSSSLSRVILQLPLARLSKTFFFFLSKNVHHRSTSLRMWPDLDEFQMYRETETSSFVSDGPICLPSTPCRTDDCDGTLEQQQDEEEIAKKKTERQPTIDTAESEAISWWWQNAWILLCSENVVYWAMMVFHLSFMWTRNIFHLLSLHSVYRTSSHQAEKEEEGDELVTRAKMGSEKDNGESNQQRRETFKYIFFAASIVHSRTKPPIRRHMNRSWSYIFHHLFFSSSSSPPMPSLFHTVFPPFYFYFFSIHLSHHHHLLLPSTHTTHCRSSSSTLLSHNMLLRSMPRRVFFICRAERAER